MKQETVCATPVEIFSVSDSGASTSKGMCVCAVVALPSRPPKYTLVCYNTQQVTLCVARMNWMDAQSTSLRLVVDPSGHTSFTDDAGQRWTLFFAEEVQLIRFLACVGVAFYSLYGAPVTSIFYQDLSLPSSSLQLRADHRASVSFCEFELCERNGICSVGKMNEQRGGHDASPPYAFRPKPSAMQLSDACFGFEGSVLGMQEDDRRVFVIPPGYTKCASDALTTVATVGAVYVVQLLRVEHLQEDEEVNAPAAAGNGNAGASSVAAAAAPPAVYAATAEAEDASNVRALALVGPYAAAVAAPTQVPPATSAVPAFLSPSGIPAEHMSVLRNVELGVGAAVASARDVHGVASILSQGWHQFVERPKPSLLSNGELLAQVQRVVAEEEAAQVQLDKCDRLFHSLDARNRELQQRIDRSTIESQRLLEEKNNAATKAMDARLEKDRQLVRLKDALLLKRQEREDLQRHITALQRTVEVSNEELRQVQGKRDIHQVEVSSMAERLSAMQETVSEERRRNAALVAKIAATEESLKKAQAQQRIAEGQLTTVRGLAEKERLHYVQIMEEERHHRAQDSELLRQDILHELDSRERQYQVDRHRIAEEEFARGLRDGKAEGRQAAETDLLGHQEELRLNLQRAKTEVEAAKEEVRRSIESAMALRRTLGGKVSEMKEQLAEATRKQTKQQYQLAQWQTRCRTVRDTISEHWRTLIRYATHPCTRDELLAMMSAVRAAEEESYAEDAEGKEGLVRVDLQFQSALWQQSRSKSVEQRLQWISVDMVDMYVKGAGYHFDHEWLQPITEAHNATLWAVAELYAQQHGSRKPFDLGVQEAQERYALQQQWWVSIKSMKDWLATQRTAQEAVKAEEAKERQTLWKAYVDGGDAIVLCCAAQLRDQRLLLQDEMKGRDELVAEELKLRKHLPTDAQHMWMADCAAALHVLEEEEEAARAGLEAEAHTANSGIHFQFAYAHRSVGEVVLRRTQQEGACAEEAEARLALEREATAQLEKLMKEAAAALAPSSLPPPAVAGQPIAWSPPSATAVESITQHDEQRSETANGAGAEAARASGTQLPPSPSAQADVPATASATTEDPLPAPHHVDPPSPPHSPPVPPFTLADSPRVRRDVPMYPALEGSSSHAGRLRDDTFFSEVPPPLSPSDADAEVEESADERNAEKSAAPPPPPSSSSPHASVLQQRAPSAREQQNAPCMDRNAPPPLPSDEDDVDGMPTSPSSSALSGDSPSSIALPPQVAKARAALQPSADTRHDDVFADEEQARDTGPALAASSKAKHRFGQSSSEDDDATEDSEGRAARGPRRPSPLPVRRRAAGKSGPPPPSSAVSALAKPKLFDSSDSDEALEEKK
ncbi:hypothetical protein ABL78_1163 [Leptomonas seymouri]|uniref:Uncharacterized protein n=1 Tax=Leptomonas seymouri TaxID=5684 RepID=A0A0N1PDW2_LEPSE|nr:hypothetical protein ABL78_1163 [Leptomonas seymouri]|eukprot:KPI89783.1 hypothetical protein ABL78_1163 [Leptomonas seymouri]